MSILAEAFKELDLLDDYEFDLNDEEDAKKLDKFLNDEEEDFDDIEQIVDVEADDEEDLRDTYVGSLLLLCPVCHTIHYQDEDKMVVSEDDETLVDVDVECPHCHQKGGFSVVGKVAEYNPNKEEQKEEDKLEDDEEDLKQLVNDDTSRDLDDYDEDGKLKKPEAKEEVEESLTESRKAKIKKYLQEKKQKESTNKTSLKESKVKGLSNKKCKKEPKLEESKLREKISDEAYDIADTIIDALNGLGKHIIERDELEEQFALAVRDLYGIDNVWEEVGEDDIVKINGKDFIGNELFEGDIRGILGMNGWETIYEGKHEGGVTDLDSRLLDRDEYPINESHKEVIIESLNALINEGLINEDMTVEQVLEYLNSLP